MHNPTHPELPNEVPGWQPILLAAMAGGMAWGIRGQYGHETGAMIAGLLVSLTLVFLLCPRSVSLSSVRAVAWGTVAMGFGGSMTYGQTVGLTHDSALVGNWAALRWGMLGLSIKGALWIGFAGVFLGMGLSGIRYRSREMLGLMAALLVAYFLGVVLLNSPFDPANKTLPTIYFSDHWYWEPDTELKPRFECWGGYLFALLALITYTGFWRKDGLAPRLGGWGIVGGAIGFPLGQSLQAFHAWNPVVFKTGIWVQLDPFMNWWNMMETTFGATMGAMLGLGLWLNRKRIQPIPDSEASSVSLSVEWILLAIHLPLLIAVEFMSIHWVDRIYDLGLIMGIIPIVAVTRGCWWPYWIIFPVTLLPIAGKTVRQLVYSEAAISPIAGWIVYWIVPLLLAVGLAVWFGRRVTRQQTRNNFFRMALWINTWIYFLLNWAFFHFPWPWAAWTARTTNGILFTLCAFGLTAAVLFCRRSENKENSPVSV